MKILQQVFERVEKKYLLTKEQLNLLLKKIKDKIIKAEYTNYTICNIYFDTDNYDLIRNSLDKPLYKEKVRLRSYGIPTEKSKVFLEIKKKYKKVVNKRRVTLPLSEMKKYLEDRDNFQKKSQVLKEIDYLFDYYKLQPKLYLAYDRIAYIGKEDNQLRITFDYNIRSRRDKLCLEAGDMGEYLLEDQYYLMEIKGLGSFPLWLTQTLSNLEIFPVSFSKYGRVYEKIRNSKKEVKKESAIYV